MQVRSFAAPIAIAGILLISGAANAGPYTDALSMCLAERSTAAEKTQLMRWMFVALATHPDVSSLAAITENDRAEVSRAAGQLFMNLLTETCEREARAAMKYEGNSAIEASFNAFGQIAARGLMGHPDVNAYVADLGNHVDSEKLDALMANPD